MFMTKRPDTDSLPIRTQEERALDIEILIVDDDRPIADLLKDALSGAERRVDVCYEGLSAIEKIQEKNYDLIIVDLVMPRVDGLELLRYAKGIKPDVIVIIITGHASLETAISAIREGAYNYIRKPFKL
ncbi:MAG: response regulator, partial [Deltaproteobacteria bacterium]|nr:response regulator [Deltaproteobacteria bacterium]